MKRHNFFSKSIKCLLAISMSIFLFAGCKSNSNNGAAAASSNQSSTQSSSRPNLDQMKKKIQDSIQPLVTAGTITQDQANKIVEAFTTRSNGGGQNRTQNKQQGNNQKNGQNRQRNNSLAKLVSDGVITQAQADAVMQKMKGNLTRRNNGQNSQNNNGQSTSN